MDRRKFINLFGFGATVVALKPIFKSTPSANQPRQNKRVDKTQERREKLKQLGYKVTKSVPNEYL